MDDCGLSFKTKQQFYIMKETMNQQVETDANSPDKQSPSTFQNPHPTKNYIIREAIPHPSNNKLSKTQKEIYSRSILRQVIQAHKHKSIKHDVNQIHHQSKLYAQPIQNFHNDLQFESIPPKNKQYSSVCSAKIHRISKAFSQQKYKTSAHLHPLKGNQKQKNASSIDKNNNISVSGLVTYKFNSVNAQRSLGYNQINYVENMQNDIVSLRGNRECSRTRQNLIVAKGSRKKYQRYIRTDQAIMRNFSNSTEDYLKDLIKQKEQNQMIYNQKANKLKYIKELMQEDNMNYDDAHHIVEQIEDIHACEPDLKVKAPIVSINQQYQIKHRRVSSKKKRIYVRCQTFVD